MTIPNVRADSETRDWHLVSRQPPVESNAERDRSFRKEGNDISTPFATAGGVVNAQLRRASSIVGNTLIDR
jgi:hypothetical protein